MSNINTVALSGNLTRDAETRPLANGNSVTNLRLAVNTRKKVGDEWVDAPNYFDLVVWGPFGETIAKYTHKGSSILISGRLEWREWETDGEKRQSVQVVVQDAQFFFAKTSSDDEPSQQLPGGLNDDDDSIPF